MHGKRIEALEASQVVAEGVAATQEQEVAEGAEDSGGDGEVWRGCRRRRGRRGWCSSWLGGEGAGENFSGELFL
jgi:hypothetical protein